MVDDEDMAETNWRRVLVVALCAMAALPLLLGVRPMEQQPYTDSAQYRSAAIHLADGDGYVIDTSEPFIVREGDGEVRPQYPPGYSLLLAGFEVAGGIEWGPPMLAVGLVVALVAYAWRLGGVAAAGVAAVALFWSPFLVAHSRIYMSDLSAALFVVLLLLAASYGRYRLAGLVAGVAVAVRFTAIGPLAALMLLAPRRKHVAAGAVGPLAGLAAFQWVAYGSPISTGYDSGRGLFRLEHLWSSQLSGDPDLYGHEVLSWQVPQLGLPADLGLPSPLLYAAILAGAFWLFGPPLLPLVGMVEMWRRRWTTDGRVAAGVIVASVAAYLPYYHQGPRFMASAGFILVAFAAAGISAAGSEKPSRERTHPAHPPTTG